jgi:hypothetical protein
MYKDNKQKAIKTKDIKLKPCELYEQAFQAIAHRHLGCAEWNKYYPGKLSQDPSNERQIDVTICLPNGELVLVECRQKGINKKKGEIYKVDVAG